VRARHARAAIYAERPEQGLVLIEDFGNDRMRDWLDDNPARRGASLRRAIDALVELHRAAGAVRAVRHGGYQREAGLFVEWFCPAMELAVDEAGWRAAWDAVLAPMLPRQQPGVTVLRDYHAENIMLLARASQG
jgi:aminoglycoside/choline kinase family phosphotransferase